MNVFQQVTEHYGEELARDAIGLIDWYVDDYYTEITGREHDGMTRAKRMVFAEKLLDCADELDLTLEDMEHVLMIIAKYTEFGKYDPTIYYVTSPRVLGYWISSELEVDMIDLSGTPYMPVGNCY